MKLIVGLGNPGKRYVRTRHNAGYRVVEALAVRYDARFHRSWRAKARTAKCHVEGESLLLAKPETFMNLSGVSVAALMRRKGFDVADLIVVFDDVDLDVGQLRVRPKGGAGGHNGLRSVIREVGSEVFTRVRLGVGRCPPRMNLADYVLSDFLAEEEKIIEETVGKAVDAVECVLRDGTEAAMNRFN